MSSISPYPFQTKTGAGVTIRCAMPEDAEPLIDLKREIIAERDFTTTQPEDFDRTPAQELDYIRDQLRKPGNIFLVVELEKRIIGYLGFSNGDKVRTAHVGHFYIYLHKAYREQGIGSVLLRTMLDWATANPLIEKVTLGTFSTNLRAIAAYEKMGFQVEGRCPKDMKIGPGEYIDRVLMYQFVKPV